jgi:hypothetical protein
VQALGRMREQFLFVYRASLHWHAVPDRGDRFVQPRCTIDDEELGRRRFNIGRNTWRFPEYDLDFKMRAKCSRAETAIEVVIESGTGMLPEQVYLM